MATTILTADSNLNTLWNVYAFSNINTASDSNVASANRNDDGEAQQWGYTSVGVAGTASQVQVRVRHRFYDYDAEEASVKSASIRVRINGSWSTPETITTNASGFIYSTITVTGSWNTSDFDDFAVEISAPASISGQDELYEVDHVEPTVTYTLSTPSTLYRLGGGNWSDGSKWSTTSGGAAAGVAPGTTTAVIFDGNSSGTITIDGNVEIASLDCQFTGTLDANDYDVTINGDVTLACTTLVWGTGDWTIAGDCDYSGMTNGPTTDYNGLRSAVSRLTLTGTSKTLTPYSTGLTLGALIITGSITVDANGTLGHTLDLRGSFTVDTGVAFIARCVGTSAEGVLLDDGATLTGNGTFWISGTGLMQFGDGATLDVATLNLADNSTTTEIVASTISSASVNFQAGLGNTYQMSGGIVFTGDVTFYAEDDGAPANIVVDNSTDDPTITFQGDLIFSESGSYEVQWDAGDGGALFSGSATQQVNIAGKNIGDITINKSAGTWQQTGDAACESFTVTQGTIDHDGYDLTVTGNYTIGINGQTSGDQGGSLATVGGNLSLTGEVGDLLVINNLDFDVTGTTTASYCNVTNSDASAGTQIDASDETSTDNGGNVNWLFEPAFNPAWARYANTMVGV